MRTPPASALTSTLISFSIFWRAAHFEPVIWTESFSQLRISTEPLELSTVIFPPGLKS